MNSTMRLAVASIVLLLLILPCLAGCSSGEKESPEAEEPTRSPQGPEWMNEPVVSTEYGAVCGLEDQANTWVWKAIPFAKPPVGDLRWKAPRDPDPWEGIREEEEFCTPCSQLMPSMTGAPSNTIMGGEDCLYLNIWRPRTEETDLPVYFWIHGGGNAIGSATLDPGTYGSSLADKSNMVFVSANYRLGPFGWFTHPALRSGDPADDSGNFGTLDIIKALRWVRDNIAPFGGDPENVMVSGISAGGVNILSLLISPEAEGLFHRALVQSGMKVATPIEDGEASARAVLLKLLQNDGTATDPVDAEAHLADMGNQEIAAYLRAKRAKEIFACYEQMGFGMVAFPFIFADGEVIPEEGFAALDTGTYPNKVPIILGSSKEESKIFLFMDPYFEGRDELYQTVATCGGELWKAAAVDEVARKLSMHQDQPPVYVYRFDWGAWQEDGGSPIPEPYDLKLGACHSLDVPFFLGSDSFNVYMTDWFFTEENRPGREALSEAIMSYQAQFARTGNPNSPGSPLPEWAAWSNEPGTPKCMLFDATVDSLAIAMSEVEVTRAGTLERMAAELSAPIYSEAMEYIQSNSLLSHLIDAAE